MLLIILAAFIVINGVRSRALRRALDFTLLSFQFPRATPSNNQQQDEKKLIALMEQVYSSVATMHTRGWNKLLYGDPYIILEMAVPHVGEQIHFYAAVPNAYTEQFKRQIYGVFPSVQVAQTPDYNIFHPQGAVAGGWMKLKEEPILPIATYTDLPADPLGPLVSAFSHITADGEGAAIQVVVRPSSDHTMRRLAQDVARHLQTGHDFKSAMKLAQHPPKKKTPSADDPAVTEPPRVATEFDQKLIRALQSKASRPLFDCNVRLMTSGATQERANELLGELENAFAQYASPDGNAFSLQKAKGGSLEKLVYQFSFRLFNSASDIQLSSEEVTSIYHLPVTASSLPKVKFTNFRASEPPSGISPDGIAFGENIFQGKSTMLRLSDEDRRRHMYIVGQTGTGKTVTMQSMIAQDMASGNGLTVLDPHGSLAEWVLANVPRERADDVIYFDPSDPQYAMGLNLLEYDPTSPQDKTLIVDELFEIMNKLYNMKEAGGPQFEQYFKNAIFLLLDNADRRVATLADLSRVFIDEAFRNDLLAHESNTLVKQFWEKDATQRTGEQSLSNFTGYITSKVDAFTNNDFLRTIVNQPKSVFDFKDVIENKKILIANLTKGKIGDMNAQLLGMVIVGKLRRTALARDTTRNTMPDHFVYMDEFQSFTTNSISVILAEARKYRLCLIMAHQFIKQLDEQIRDSVFGNVGTIVAARVSPEDAESPVLKTRFEPNITPYDLSNMDNFNAYVVMLVNGQVGRPCNMRILTEQVFNKGSSKVRDALTEISRLKYGRLRIDIEAEIQGRFKT